jgi:hypothetical protein
VFGVFRGYNADNLESNGVHKVESRRFVLVSADHPLITAISENSDQLQATDVEQMAEQMVKVAQPLYDTLMPLVKEQVRSQIKVCDMSRANVSIHPAEYASWEQVAQRLVVEQQTPITQRREQSIAAMVNSPTDVELIKAEYANKLRDVESKVYHTPRDFFLEITAHYNFL